MADKNTDRIRTLLGGNMRGKSRFARQAAEAAAKAGLSACHISIDPATGELRREIIRPEDFYIKPSEKE